MKLKMLIFFWCSVMIVQQIKSQTAFTLTSCTQRNPKIVGGSEAERHEMPFMVSLTRRGGHFCGATIIHEKWILTAGHCICNGLNKFMKPAQIQGVMGLHSISQYLNGLDSEAPKKVNFKNIVPHPNYICTNSKNDIALLELIQPIRFSRHIQPCCLSTATTIKSHENEYATVSGWGWTQENQAIGDRADILRKADVRVWNNNVCERSYQSNGRPNSITDTQLCAGYENGGIDSCWVKLSLKLFLSSTELYFTRFADSGGPLISKENFLIGVVSTGIGCARPGLPGIYTRVSKYVSWMESVIFPNN